MSIWRQTWRTSVFHLFEEPITGEKAKAMCGKVMGVVTGNYSYRYGDTKCFQCTRVERKRAQ